MSALLIILISAGIFIAAYKIYATRIEALWAIDENRPTPAVVKNDGIDYVPSENWFVLFGHHFASIAGAGPIIGPVIAVCFWGWAPALIWITLGSIFMGGIHDYGALMMSVREGGATIGEIAETAISKRAKIILSIFTWLALLLVIAVFAYLGADTFVKQPKIVIPSLGILPIAVVLGLALSKFKLPPVPTTIAALAVMMALTWVGNYVPVRIPGNAQSVWLIVLLIYCFFASILPVNVLLQPRDYLTSFLLIGGILLAFTGIVVTRPDMNTPAFIANKSSIGYLWPMMFITIACGANSGFHSLIASGTTSKQLANERHAKRIGIGSMLVEGFLATIVVVLIVGGFTRIEFQQLIAAKTSPVQMYGLGFGNVTAPILGQWGTFIALTVLNAFILTTLDSATRITRYITEELFGIRNRFVSTTLILIIGGWLALGKDSANNPLWQKIWPAFGASNQLVAALALLVITCWLFRKGKPTRYALIPALFMLGTSITALVFQLQSFWKSKDFVLIGVASILIFSALALCWEVVQIFRRLRQKAATI